MCRYLTLDFFNIQGLPDVFSRYNVLSSLITSPAEHLNMLQFASFHGIEPIIETSDLNEMRISAAFEKLKKGEMRYCGVLIA